MPKKNTLENLSKALVALNDATCVSITSELLKEGLEPVEILTCCEHALALIGEKYAAGEYYIAGLIMAGELMSRISTLVMPHLPQSQARGSRGRILIGTVQGDIHGLGKDITGALLSAHGFQVKDLGVDVPPADFLQACESFQPDAVGLSVLLSICLGNLAETVAELRGWRGSRARPHIFISGASIQDEHRQRFKADFSVGTAIDAVRLCERLLPAS